MLLKKVFAVASVAALVGGISMACSSTVTLPAATPDAGEDDGSVGAPKDSGRRDGSDTMDDASATVTCKPGDVATFKPVWKSPNPKKGVCKQSEIDAFLTGCLGNTATSQTCAPFSKGGPAYLCGQCITTPDTAQHYGPLIDHNGYVVPNVAGCIAAATGDTTGAGCGGKLSALDQCQAAACKVNCPISDNASLTALNNCTSTASDGAGGCAKYATEALACRDDVVDAGGLAAACVAGSSFDESYNAIVPIFCLGTDDGGTDAADAADSAVAPADAADGG